MSMVMTHHLLLNSPIWPRGIHDHSEQDPSDVSGELQLDCLSYCFLQFVRHHVPEVDDDWSLPVSCSRLLSHVHSVEPAISELVVIECSDEIAVKVIWRKDDDNVCSSTLGDSS